jgi:hypothetical protein
LIEGSVRSVGVVVLDELGQDVAEVSWSGDEDVVEAFSAQGADPALRDRVRPESLRWRLDDADSVSVEDVVEGSGELGVAIADQEPELLGAVGEVHQQVANLLGHPIAAGMGGDPGDVHAAGGVLDDDQEVEPAEDDGVDVGEVDGEDGMGLRGEELSPGGTGPSGRGIESGVLEDLMGR